MAASPGKPANLHSLTLAPTTPSRSTLRGIGPGANDCRTRQRDGSAGTHAGDYLRREEPAGGL
ncbi:MAG TPA: hypothetical protein VIO38_16525, partial [Rariglobus sp.]